MNQFAVVYYLAFSDNIGSILALYDRDGKKVFYADPYVQLPDFTQSFNRYSYCLNKILKYTGPTEKRGIN